MSKIIALGLVIIVFVVCIIRDARSLKCPNHWQRGHRRFLVERSNVVLSENYMSNVRVQSDNAIEKQSHESAEEVKAGLGTVQSILEEIDSANLPEKCRWKVHGYRKHAKNYMRNMRHCLMQELRDLKEFRVQKRRAIDAAITFIREINDSMATLDTQTLDQLTITVKTLLNQIALIGPKPKVCALKKVIQNIVKMGKGFFKDGC